MFYYLLGYILGFCAWGGHLKMNLRFETMRLVLLWSIVFIFALGLHLIVIDINCYPLF